MSKLVLIKINGSKWEVCGGAAKHKWHSLGCKAHSQKVLTSLESCFFKEVLNMARVGSEPVNLWTDNSINASIGWQRKS